MIDTMCISSRVEMYSSLALVFQMPASADWYSRVAMLLRDAIASVAALAEGLCAWNELIARIKEWSADGIASLPCEVRSNQFLAASALQGLSQCSMRLPPDWEMLEADFMRLFYGPGKLLAPPYESVYTFGRRQVMGPAAMSVLAAYQEAGFRLKDAYRDAPDQITAELEFMAHLCNSELDAASEGMTGFAEQVAEVERRFLEEHLSQWAPEFCEDIRRYSKTAFWPLIAQVLEQFVKWDTEACFRK